jgi:hypothetical protein
MKQVSVATCQRSAAAAVDTMQHTTPHHNTVQYLPYQAAPHIIKTATTWTTYAHMYGKFLHAASCAQLQQDS